MQAVRTIMRVKLASLCKGIVPSDLEFSTILEHVNDPDEDNAEADEAEHVVEDEAEAEQRHGISADVAEDDSDDQAGAVLPPTVPIDPALLGGFDERVQSLMSNLMKPGHEFDNGIETFRDEPSDFEDEGIYGPDSE